jgi:hypothetical protein
MPTNIYVTFPVWIIEFSKISRPIRLYLQALPENYRKVRGILIPHFLSFDQTICDSSNFILRVGSNGDIIGYQIPL